MQIGSFLRVIIVGKRIKLLQEIILDLYVKTLKHIALIRICIADPPSVLAF